jgi:hypothetical protein
MSERPAINAADLSPELRKKLGLPRRAGRRSMTMDDVRTAAIRVLNVIADLTPSERGRVLRHAQKVNDV